MSTLTDEMGKLEDTANQALANTGELAGELESLEARVTALEQDEPDPAPPGRKSNGGHYHKIQYSIGESDWKQKALNQIDKSLECPQMIGSWLSLGWGAIEKQPGQFTWKDFDDIVAALPPGRKLIVDLPYKAFNTSTPTNLAPPDILSSPDCIDNGKGFVLALWRPAVMDRYIAWLQAFAARFDATDWLELAQCSESSASMDQSVQPPDYSTGALAAQLKRLYPAASKAFAKTWFCANLNYLSNQVGGLMESAYVNDCAFSGPDAKETDGEMVFRGESDENSGTSERDYRYLMPHAQIASSAVLGGKDDNGPATNVINWAQGQAVTHLSWISSSSAPGCTWTDIKNAIAADPMLADLESGRPAKCPEVSAPRPRRSRRRQ